jgi:hypothetical protein
MSVRHRVVAALSAAGAITTAALAVAPIAQAAPGMPSSYIGHFHKLRTIASTIPHNGDLNPYGIFVIRSTTGRLAEGSVLISNFNAKSNLQGTGSTIVEISPGGHRTLFAQVTAKSVRGRCPGGVGLTTALEVLPGGWVLVGSTPSKDGSTGTTKAGCLIMLNKWGTVVKTFSGHGINGPWDSTMVTFGRAADVFVTNVMNGIAGSNSTTVVHKGTVLRLTFALSRNRIPQLVARTTVGSGFALQSSSTAFVLGPTGVGVGRHGTLYVADTQTSAITAIPHALSRPGSAGIGMPVSAGGLLSAPLGMAIAPNGDILTVNGNDGNLVETTPAGAQIAHFRLDSSGGPPPGAGALFGLAVKPHFGGVYYVDDAANTLRLLH